MILYFKSTFFVAFYAASNPLRMLLWSKTDAAVDETFGVLWVCQNNMEYMLGSCYPR